MELEKQVCSLELAKRLKELGVKQRGTLFAYFFNAGKWTGDIVDAVNYEPNDDEYYKYKIVAAFTVAELGEMLPRTVGSYILICAFNPDSSECAISYFMASNSTHHPEIKSQYGDTEADTRAKMLIYLLENNLVTPKDI